MRRAADQRDESRYQTVFAKHLGSAAAPTAGLHVTPAMLERMGALGVRVARLTLHVGIGTFRPVTTDDLDQHVMHSEAFEVSAELASAIAETRRIGGRVVAVGTTVVRALEAAADPECFGLVRAEQGRTNLLIQPGYRFRAVDALLTNFHMPKSTLLALVAAFVGHERVLGAYRAAALARYRFLSYGDAMWIPARLGELPL
jgi:S-adenosylmethionine:tRNA ribosyltransferase-isomerase